MKTCTGLFISGIMVTLVAGAVLWAGGVGAVSGDQDPDCPERLFGLYCPDDPSPVDNPNIDCPGRAFGLYCPEDPSPVDDPNIDCPGRAFGLYCPGDPSPEENPNLTSPTPTPTPAADQPSDNGGGDNGGGDGGDDSEEPQPTPTPKPKQSRVLGVSASDRKASDFIPNHLVPSVVERMFGEVFDRQLTHTESVYWKGRARSDKATESKLLGAMSWHKAHGSTGVKQPKTASQSQGGSSLVPRINALFRLAYGRNPLVSENQYWLTRIVDKPTEVAMVGAMQFHLINGISH